MSADLPPSVAVAAIGEVLNYLFDTGNDEDARAGLLKRVHAALVPGGLFMFDIAGPERAKQAGQRTFAEGPDWTVLVKTDWDAAAGVLSRTITSFRQIGTLYARDVEIHRLALIDPAHVLEQLHAAGFDARAIHGYGATPLPDGVTAFMSKRAARPADGRPE